ncbi:MAG: CDP-glycerol glycerophosphotransferase family protein [Lachnospiraceae bacterium]|nr:CDP-glycerol glycerophosphotransferase family protein [Lachnospiraceae bacterium]
MKKIKECLKTLAKDVVLKGYYPALYRRLSRRPVEKKVVLLEVRRERLSENFETIYPELRRGRGWKVRVCCIQEGVADRLTVIRNCRRAIREISTASVVLMNDTCYMIGALPLRPETKVIQLWHACGAFKRVGYSTADAGFGRGTKELEKYGLYRNISKVAVSSPGVRWAYAEAFDMKDRPEDVVAAGVARTDLFYSRKRVKKAYERLHSVLPELSGSRRIVLYAPTFRGQSGQAFSPEELDLVQLKRQLGERCCLLIKHHPLVKKRPPIPAECSGFAFDVSDRMDITDLLMTADICITDYSSVIFEYSLLNRPIILFAPDLEAYYDERGFYYPFDQIAPGPVAKTTEELGRYVENIEEYFDPDALEDFRIRFMSACDGHATRRVLELMEELWVKYSACSARAPQEKTPSTNS